MKGRLDQGVLWTLNERGEERRKGIKEEGERVLLEDVRSEKEWRERHLGCRVNVRICGEGKGTGKERKKLFQH